MLNLSEQCQFDEIWNLSQTKMNKMPEKKGMNFELKIWKLMYPHLNHITLKQESDSSNAAERTFETHL